MFVHLLLLPTLPPPRSDFHVGKIALFGLTVAGKRGGLSEETFPPAMVRCRSRYGSVRACGHAAAAVPSLQPCMCTIVMRLCMC